MSIGCNVIIPDAKYPTCRKKSMKLTLHHQLHFTQRKMYKKYTTSGINDTEVKGEVIKGDWISTSAKSLGISAQILARPEKYGYPKKAADLCKRIMLKHYEDNGLARHLPWSPFVEEVTTMEALKKYKSIYAGMELYGKAGYTPGYREEMLLISKHLKVNMLSD